MFYNNIFAAHSSSFYFSKIFRKLEQIATRCHCPVTLFIVLKDHKSAEAITLTRESYEDVVCQAALEQGYEIENVAATEGTDFSCKPAQLVITKFIDCESKKELLSGLQHVRNTVLHLKVIDLDPNRGILVLFILPLNTILLNMNSFPDISKQSVKSQTIFKSFYKKNILLVPNLFRSFIHDKL